MAKSIFENAIPGLPQDTEEVGLLLNTSSQEAVSRIKMAEAMVEALDYLATAVRNKDFFTGYSLSEVITERLAQIGGDDSGSNSFNVRRRTLLAELTFLEETLVETIEKAIESLENVGEVEMVVDTEQRGF